ncbi:unnamed protein product [Polarella glacialis]|uniref:Uncharacterized protein n=2 Tax=Polarella glacialis TaxID=89957 RepID=A0A813LLD5_POLGL|nr:unnamed protein product [Polarella glacialis]
MAKVVYVACEQVFTAFSVPCNAGHLMKAASTEAEALTAFEQHHPDSPCVCLYAIYLSGDWVKNRRLSNGGWHLWPPCTTTSCFPATLVSTPSWVALVAAADLRIATLSTALEGAEASVVHQPGLAVEGVPDFAYVACCQASSATRVPCHGENYMKAADTEKAALAAFRMKHPNTSVVCLFVVDLRTHWGRKTRLAWGGWHLWPVRGSASIPAQLVNSLSWAALVATAGLRISTFATAPQVAEAPAGRRHEVVKRKNGGFRCVLCGEQATFSGDLVAKACTGLSNGGFLGAMPKSCPIRPRAQVPLPSNVLPPDVHLQSSLRLLRTPFLNSLAKQDQSPVQVEEDAPAAYMAAAVPGSDTEETQVPEEDDEMLELEVDVTGVFLSKVHATISQEGTNYTIEAALELLRHKWTVVKVEEEQDDFKVSRETLYADEAFFSQDRCSARLRNGKLLTEVVQDLDCRRLDPLHTSWLQLEIIKIRSPVTNQWKFYSNDNRRLWCLKQHQLNSGRRVAFKAVVHTAPQWMRRFMDHFSTTSDGRHISMRESRKRPRFNP